MPGVLQHWGNTQRIFQNIARQLGYYLRPFFHSLTFELDVTRVYPAGTQYPEISAECFPSVAIFGTSSEHLGNILKQNIFKKVLDRKVVSVLKVYDLIITNVDLLANSSNHEVMFPEYSRNIPRMSVSKIFQGYPRNIVKLWKYF